MSKIKFWPEIIKYQYIRRLSPKKRVSVEEAMEQIIKYSPSPRKNPYMKDNSHKTAIRRNAMSAPTKKLIQLGLLKTESYILDYGCGRGDDVEQLSKIGYSVFGWDPHWADNKSILKKKYHIIICNYVLCATDQDQDEIIKDMRSLLRKNGIIYLSVRRDIKEDTITSIGTKQRYVELDVEKIYEDNSYCIYKIEKEE